MKTILSDYRLEAIREIAKKNVAAIKKNKKSWYIELEDLLAKEYDKTQGARSESKKAIFR